MNQVEARARRDIDVLRDELSAMTGQFSLALPAQIPPDRFVRVAMTALQNDPKLLQCDRKSLWNAFMKAAQDGLLPDGREGAVIPFNTKVTEGGKEAFKLVATWIPMIAGLRKKVRNSGVMADWYAEVIYENDKWAVMRGTEQYIRHEPNIISDRGKAIAAYSVAFLKGDEGFSFDIMSAVEIERVRNLSKSPNGPGWKNHPVEMWKKTVARRHSKILPMSTDLDDLLRRDDEVHGSADFDALPAPGQAARPQIQDFSQDTPKDETAAGEAPSNGKAASRPDEAKKSAGPDEKVTDNVSASDVGKSETNQHDPETGEVQPSPADAFERGRQDREKGRALKATPVEWREPQFQSLADAWGSGWRQKDEEIAAAKAKK